MKDVSEKLANLTVEHELEMRRIVVALEKHAAIFESVERALYHGVVFLS